MPNHVIGFGYRFERVEKVTAAVALLNQGLETECARETTCRGIERNVLSVGYAGERRCYLLDHPLRRRT